MTLSIFKIILSSLVAQYFALVSTGQVLKLARRNELDSNTQRFSQCVKGERTCAEERYGNQVLRARDNGEDFTFSVGSKTRQPPRSNPGHPYNPTISEPQFSNPQFTGGVSEMRPNPPGSRWGIISRPKITTAEEQSKNGGGPIITRPTIITHRKESTSGDTIKLDDKNHNESIEHLNNRYKIELMTRFQNLLNNIKYKEPLVYDIVNSISNGILSVNYQTINKLHSIDKEDLVKLDTILKAFADRNGLELKVLP